MHDLSVRTYNEHEAALREIEALWTAEDGTKAGDRLDILAASAEAYESRRWPIPTPDPATTIRS